ncbi:MAG: alpha/beta fold hydrolase, partial [Bacteroidota bacterium]|nr:alpha/beta fold hydrolase [Bacteroidota bacterium]
MNLFKFIAFVFLLLSINNAFCQDGFINGAPQLAYWKIGDKKDIVIILHGGPGAAHNYLRPEWDTLSNVAQVIYYDQRGCGKSEVAECYSWRQHVLDLRRVIAQFSNGRKVVLAGSSWGYTLALLYTYSYPQDIKGVILSGITIWEGKGEDIKDCSFYIPDKTKSPYLGKDTIGYMNLKLFSADISKIEKKDKGTKVIEIHNFSFNNTLNSLIEAPSLKELIKINVPVLAFEGNGNCGRNPH